MKKFMLFTLITTLASFASQSAHALDWVCGRSLEVRSYPNIDGPDAARAYLLMSSFVDKEGKVHKKFKPLAASTEAIADFLLEVATTGQTTPVCIKYYDSLSPAPVPLMVLDLKHDQSGT